MERPAFACGAAIGGSHRMTGEPEAIRFDLSTSRLRHSTLPVGATAKRPRP